LGEESREQVVSGRGLEGGDVGDKRRRISAIDTGMTAE
jgi:hypothetical protein